MKQNQKRTPSDEKANAEAVLAFIKKSRSTTTNKIAAKFAIRPMQAAGCIVIARIKGVVEQIATPENDNDQSSHWRYIGAI